MTKFIMFYIVYLTYYLLYTIFYVYIYVCVFRHSRARSMLKRVGDIKVDSFGRTITWIFMT